IFHFYSSSFYLCNRFQIWFTLIIPIVHVFFKHLYYKKTCLYIFLYLSLYIDNSFYITFILLFKLSLHFYFFFYLSFAKFTFLLFPSVFVEVDFLVLLQK